MWIYIYKFDKHGCLLKYKTQLVVHGDQQVKTASRDIYTATLAARLFQTFMTIAACFNLELK